MRSFRKNQKFLVDSFLKGLVVHIDRSVRKQSWSESSLKPKLWKREFMVSSHSSCQKSETHRVSFSSGSKIFETWPKGNHVKKRARFSLTRWGEHALTDHRVSRLALGLDRGFSVGSGFGWGYLGKNWTFGRTIVFLASHLQWPDVWRQLEARKLGS